MTDKQAHVTHQADVTTNESGELLLENQVCFSLYSAANAIIRAYRPLLDAIDLTYPQYLTMMVLWANDGINVKDMGAKLHLDSGTLTPLLKRLETKGLLDRKRALTDERVREIWLTEAGKALKDKAKTIPYTMFCKSELPFEELAALKSTCDKLLNTIN
ncbi:MarR family transcriptional regulator [Motilimonas cestriensis]|uniref:MarR family transcriptional regulator n=1 Tax=Motilimonas cestriensis TaxID=2742685 RepID=A0ABS8W419_9GAMM|nr:MarR family transcriptional regulator [Motilimonas cestriensis]MCE2593694.1 MarR family transcriptional regulator [Motilimonas cestriensis]